MHYDLKRFRLENKIKQSDVADKTGLSQPRISRYENGDRTVESSIKIKKAFEEDGIENYRLENKTKVKAIQVELNSSPINRMIELEKTKKILLAQIRGIETEKECLIQAFPDLKNLSSLL